MTYIWHNPTNSQLLLLAYINVNELREMENMGVGGGFFACFVVFGAFLFVVWLIWCGVFLCWGRFCYFLF